MISMVNIFKRLLADPARIYKEKFSTLNDKRIIKQYSQTTGNPEVPSISGLDSVVRLNSTYLELVDRLYYWRGMATLYGGVAFFWMFILCFLWILIQVLLKGGVDLVGWTALIVSWGIIALPVSWVSYKALISEILGLTYYPIRFNRVNKMVYMYQAGEQVLAVPWRDITFVLGSNGGWSESWSIFGCITDESGEKVTAIIPLPARLNWSQESLGIFWEFIRCYMEEGDESLPDLADATTWCVPVEKQKESWLFGLLYLYKQYVWLGLIINLPLLPVILLISIVRWVIMQTSRIPVWPEEVEAACQVADNDPVNKGPEHNPPQLWRQMLAIQGKKRFDEVFATERAAMNRITARLKEKYGASE